ncbi:hypothetical protein O181_038425 [Austropuccinia psidii MF-1]|uniref:Uncharacterized protein n=1 Tax=Austropuccinia psidii MF-1 TaxID=1389203 RepID=A0A9Q3DCV8_9BASI|nr:hypothetical protein [Austropuccinia psidii MF-1]
MGFKSQKQNPPNPPDKTQPFNVCLASKPCGNPLLARGPPNGPRTYSTNPPNTMSELFLARVHPPNHLRTLQLVSQNQRWLQHNPWRNCLVSPNFPSPLLCPSPARPATPHSIVIIDNTPVRSPPPIAAENPTASSPPVPSSSHSYIDACQELTDLQLTLMIPQAINQILLEHFRLLHMNPCVDATHQNEMHQEFREELNSLLGQALEAYPKEDITGIVSKYLEK